MASTLVGVRGFDSRAGLGAVVAPTGERVFPTPFPALPAPRWIAANTKARRQHLEDSERKRPPIRASRFTTLGQQRYRDEFHHDYISFRE